jgi:hypothetical protein
LTQTSVSNADLAKYLSFQQGPAGIADISGVAAGNDNSKFSQKGSRSNILAQYGKQSDDDSIRAKHKLDNKSDFELAQYFLKDFNKKIGDRYDKHIKDIDHLLGGQA